MAVIENIKNIETALKSSVYLTIRECSSTDRIVVDSLPTGKQEFSFINDPTNKDMQNRFFICTADLKTKLRISSTPCRTASQSSNYTNMECMQLAEGEISPGKPITVLNVEELFRRELDQSTGMYRIVSAKNSYCLHVWHDPPISGTKVVARVREDSNKQLWKINSSI